MIRIKDPMIVKWTYRISIIILCFIIILLLVQTKSLKKRINILLHDDKSCEVSNILTYQSVRIHFITDQCKNIRQPFALVVGDSIIKGLYMLKLGNIPVINAGIGWAGIEEIKSLIQKLIPSLKAKRIVVAIGINDARKNIKLENWHNSYREVIHFTKKITNDITLCSILPLEKNKISDADYFNKTEKGLLQ